jgi:hypothetical protein
LLASLGGKLSGGRLDRARRSPQWREDRFRNPEPTRTLMPGSLRAMARQQLCGNQIRHPERGIPVESRTARDYERRSSACARHGSAMRRFCSRSKGFAC